MKKLLALGVLGVFGMMAGAHAAAITGVTVAGVSSQFTDYGLDRAATHSIDGSGTDFSTGFTSNTANGTMWLTMGDGLYGPADNSPYIQYNLGSLYDIGDLNIWNYNESGYTDRGIASADVYTSTDGINYSFLTSLTLTQAPGTTDTDFHQTFSLDTTAQYVELTNFGSFAGDDNKLMGLSEVEFFTAASVAPVSEPASFAVLGIGLIGLVVARKRLAS